MDYLYQLGVEQRGGAWDKHRGLCGGYAGPAGRNALVLLKDLVNGVVDRSNWPKPNQGPEPIDEVAFGVLINAIGFVVSEGPTPPNRRVTPAQWVTNVSEVWRACANHEAVWSAAIGAEALSRIRYELGRRDGYLRETQADLEDRQLSRLAALWQASLGRVPANSGIASIPELAAAVSKRDFDSVGMSNDEQKALRLAVSVLNWIRDQTVSTHQVMFPTAPIPPENDARVDPGAEEGGAKVDPGAEEGGAEVATEAEGEVFWAIVSVLKQPDEAGGSPSKTLAAPWSRIIYDAHPARRSGVNDMTAFDSMFAHRDVKDELKRDSWYLVEMRPADPDCRLDEPAITGPSLGVALLLSAWAATKSCELRPMVVTGKVKSTVNEAKIDEIDGRDAKLRAANNLVGRLNLGRHLFLLPEKNYDPAKAGTWKVDYTHLAVHPLPLLLKDLFTPEYQLKLLTDGFDAYRQASLTLPEFVSEYPLADEIRKAGAAEAGVLGSVPGEDAGYLPKDWVHLEELIDRWQIDRMPACLRVEEGTEHLEAAIPVPFDEDPDPAARFVVKAFLKRLQVEREKGRNLTELPVPLPICLTEVASCSGDAVGRELSKRIREAVVRWMPEDPLPSFVLDNLFQSGQLHKLLLIVFSDPSCRLKYDAEEHAVGVLKRLCEQTKPASEQTKPTRPSVLFVASDLHHARMIEATWMEKARAETSEVSSSR